MLPPYAAHSNRRTVVLCVTLTRAIRRRSLHFLEFIFGVSMKILVRNLSRETTEAELLALFEAYGAVQYCKVVMDKATGKSKGFGFVEMPRAGEAKAAIKELNARDIGGNKIRVKKAEKSEEGSVGKDPEAPGRDGPR